MNNSNSFNVCPRCGSSNGINHKYCYQCGAQLKVPEEPVLCPKCHTVNTGTARFCRNCGTSLKAAPQSKICPKCGRQVSAESSTCACGYTFGGIAAEQQTSAPKKEASKPAYQRKGGRVVAIFALIFMLAFAYVIMFPSSMQPGFLGALKGVSYAEDGTTASGYEILYASVSKAMEGNLPSNMFDWLVTALVAVFSVVVVVQLICCIVRLFSGKKGKHVNVTYLVLAIVTTICAGMLAMAQFYTGDFLSSVWALFRSDSAAMGYCLLLIPAYFWFFFIFSLFAKARKAKA